MNIRSIKGTFDHDNRKAREALNRMKKPGLSRRRSERHMNQYCGWLARTALLSMKIIHGHIK